MFYNQLTGGDSLKTFGERLRELRHENHITGDELGKKFNVTKTAISYWENGKSFSSIMSERHYTALYNLIQ